MENQEKEIVAFVRRVRSERGIRPDVNARPEPSGAAFDEFELLLDFQLMHTIEGLGAWSALSDDEIRLGVYEVVRRRELAREQGRPGVSK